MFSHLYFYNIRFLLSTKKIMKNYFFFWKKIIQETILLFQQRSEPYSQILEDNIIIFGEIYYFLT